MLLDNKFYLDCRTFQWLDWAYFTSSEVVHPCNFGLNLSVNCTLAIVLGFYILFDQGGWFSVWEEHTTYTFRISILKMQMVHFLTNVIIWKTTTCITHNYSYIIYAYELTSLSKCINFLLIGVSVYDVHGSVILCCTVTRITGWFNVPQFNLHSQTQWHSCDGIVVNETSVMQFSRCFIAP